MGDLVVCADVGSTFTKVSVVDVGTGDLVARASHPTTVGTDVLDGLDAAIGGYTGAPVYLCSSAGGGLRLAVVGYESLVTAEAGHRVGLSAGARVVHVAAGPLNTSGIGALRAARPDVILLVGGTDGGDDEVLRHNARRLATARIRIPVVVAGNVDAREDVCESLTARGVPFVATDNVLPRIGVLNPMPARLAIREVFLKHVIGGKRLSRGRRFVDLVRGATPDLVLAGVEVLADHLAGDLVVIDVGGATTDVYSVLNPDPEQADGPRADVAGTLWRSRTVEGDLGMRWSATGVIEAARVEKLPVPAGLADAAAAPRGRSRVPALDGGGRARRSADSLPRGDRRGAPPCPGRAGRHGSQGSAGRALDDRVRRGAAVRSGRWRGRGPRIRTVRSVRRLAVAAASACAGGSVVRPCPSRFAGI